MALRCLLFSSDEGTADSIRQVLVSLGVEGEHCSEAAQAVERVANENLQIVIIDWDKQPEAALLLTTARQRKAAERPLTLAIVSDDASAPMALQAGANSILRKPLEINQVESTLTTARDLLRAKRDSAAQSAHAAAASSSAATPSFSVTPPSVPQPEEKPRGEFLQSSARSHAPEFVSSLDVVFPAKDMAPLAAAPAAEESSPATLSSPASNPPPDGPKGLEWYLKTRAGASAVSASAFPAPVSAKPELMGYEAPARPAAKSIAAQEGVPVTKSSQHTLTERKKEAELFAYMAGEKDASEEVPPPKSRLGKAAILGAMVLASFAIVATPQAPWHSQVRALWARGRQTLQGWLNPQPVTPVQTVAHENFARPGDEFKLPVSEPIPDATTDPTQIQVLPVVDPTAKKPNSDASNQAQPAVQPDGTVPPGDLTSPTVQVQGQPVGLPSATAQPTTGPTGTPSPTAVAAPVSAAHAETPAAIPPSLSSPSSVTVVPAPPTTPRNPPQRHASVAGEVPSSLRSQLASTTPDASGNRAPETAMASIEPVAVAEAAERALLTDQPSIAYPANVKAQGTVVLQVLIGRDGTVVDAKFLQGSLAFARNAIDGVKQWKFKPYIMNGRPVSVQTSLTLTFKSNH
ncbi:MAG TPA: TonB family protein [Candidatus Sulfotelmatobacter sp.]|nr:TonB family protein [Candidatus Sulfotelmatobacter sp.]